MQRQAFEAYELFLVDDGSLDSSGAPMVRCESKAGNFFPNCGLSARVFASRQPNPSSCFGIIPGHVNPAESSPYATPRKTVYSCHLAAPRGTSCHLATDPRYFLPPCGAPRYFLQQGCQCASRSNPASFFPMRAKVPPTRGFDLLQSAFLHARENSLPDPKTWYVSDPPSPVQAYVRMRAQRSQSPTRYQQIYALGTFWTEQGTFCV